MQCHKSQRLSPSLKVARLLLDILLHGRPIQFILHCQTEVENNRARKRPHLSSPVSSCTKKVAIFRPLNDDWRRQCNDMAECNAMDPAHIMRCLSTRGNCGLGRTSEEQSDCFSPVAASSLLLFSSWECHYMAVAIFLPFSIPPNNSFLSALYGSIVVCKFHMHKMRDMSPASY